MPVPSSLASLSTTPGGNSPTGTENPFPELDDHLRQQYAFHAQNRDAIAAKLNSSAVSAYMLTVLDDANAATARTTLGAVGNTGNETIAGVKTFSSAPVSSAAAAAANELMRKGEVDSAVAGRAALAGSASQAFAVAAATNGEHAVRRDQSFAIGQTWQNMTASRSLGQPYTNDTGKAIAISVEALQTAGPQNLFFVIGGVRMCSVGAWQAGVRVGAMMIVPAGATYLVESGNWSNPNWFELR